MRLFPGFDFDELELSRRRLKASDADGGIVMGWVLLIVAVRFVAWAGYRYRGRNDQRPGPGASEGRHGDRSAYYDGLGGG